MLPEYFMTSMTCVTFVEKIRQSAVVAPVKKTGQPAYLSAIERQTLT